MKMITRTEWSQKKAQGYTSIIEGQHYMLCQDEGSTCLMPVKILEDTYTMETLLIGNETYNHYHRLIERDVRAINELVASIENSRTEQQTPAPLDGDILIYTESDGTEQRANIEVRTYSQQSTPHLEICTYAYIPFISAELRTNTSGGPWHNMDIAEFMERAHYEGHAAKRLRAWGHAGIWADGAIVFQAQVNCWKIAGKI